MSKKQDLLIVGAGPAGCALAAKVAGRGADVVLLEDRPAPGEGRDWIVDVEHNAFEEAGVPEPCGDSRWHEPGSEISTSSDGRFKFDCLPSPLTPVRNDLYVKQLARWAEDSGAKIRCGCRVLGPLVKEGRVVGVEFTTPGGRKSRELSRVVADCSGIGGVVRKKTPPDWSMADQIDPTDIVLARREVRALDSSAARREVERGRLLEGVRVNTTAIMSSYSVRTYYLDLEQGYIDILVGGRLGGRFPTADEWFERILGEWPFVGEKVFGGGGAIPIRRTLDSLTGEGVLAIGDSACQVIPMHGSGTASALLGADLAASTIWRALEEGRYDREKLWKYCSNFQRDRGALLSYFYVIQRFTAGLSGPQVDALMEHGVITAKDFHDGLLPRPLRPGPLAAAQKVFRGRKVITRLAGFLLAGAKAELMMHHYRNYPATYDAAALDRWIKRLPRLP